MAEPNNGSVGRVERVVRIGAFPLVVIYIGLVMSGYIPFRPIDQLTSSLKEHDGRVVAAMTHQTSVDFKVAATLERLIVMIDRMDRRDHLVECARIVDRETRTQCIELMMPRPTR